MDIIVKIRHAPELFPQEAKHNSINGKTWHRYSSSTQRITLNVFFVDPNLILPGRIDTKFLI